MGKDDGTEEGEKGEIAMNKREEGWNKDEQDKEEDEYEVRNQNRRRRDNRERNQTKNEEWEKVKNRFSKEKIKPKKTAYCGYQALWSTDH